MKKILLFLLIPFFGFSQNSISIEQSTITTFITLNNDTLTGQIIEGFKDRVIVLNDYAQPIEKYMIKTASVKQIIQNNQTYNINDLRNQLRLNHYSPFKPHWKYEMESANHKVGAVYLTALSIIAVYAIQDDARYYIGGGLGLISTVKFVIAYFKEQKAATISGAVEY